MTIYVLIVVLYNVWRGEPGAERRLRVAPALREQIDGRPRRRLRDCREARCKEDLQRRQLRSHSERSVRTAQPMNTNFFPAIRAVNALLTISIFADYADFLRDDSEVVTAGSVAHFVCGGDQSKYCGLVKSFDMCHVRKYKRQCCASCSSWASPLRLPVGGPVWRPAFCAC